MEETRCIEVKDVGLQRLCGLWFHPGDTGKATLGARREVAAASFEEEGSTEDVRAQKPLCGSSDICPNHRLCNTEDGPNATLWPPGDNQIFGCFIHISKLTLVGVDSGDGHACGGPVEVGTLFSTQWCCK
jgi:hypothetical protein